MKKDIAIAVIAIVLVGALCYALAVARPNFKPTPSRPIAADLGTKNTDRVIIRVNGEPVTENEFQAAFAQLPEDVQRQFSSEQGKQAFAEQLIRMKLLEQEARRLGIDRDPKIAALLSADRTNLLASAAAQKLVATPTDQAVRTFYDQNKANFESIQLAHILIAYAGGMAPPRSGGNPPSEAQAMAKAQAIVKQLRAGVNFAQMAMQNSDDVGSAERGGDLGMVGRGMLPPELEARVFTMKEGEISDPVASRFGVHIFKAGKRAAQPIEQVRPMISRRVQQQNTLDRVELLRKTAKVEFDPKVFPEQAKRPAKKAS